MSDPPPASMPELSPAARSLVESLRPLATPTAADRARVRDALRVRLAPAPAPAPTPGPVDAPSNTVASSAGAWTAATALVLLAIAALATWFALPTPGFVGTQPATRSPSVAPRAAAPAPARALAPTLAPTLAPALAPAPAAPLAVANRVATPDASIGAPPHARSSPTQDPARQRTVDSDTFAQELALVRGAQQSLSAHEPARALASADEHARRFPSGALREERVVVRILALCELGRVAAAREAASQLLRAAPNSPSANRVRASCAAPDLVAPLRN